jgi:hypothetical protein
MAVSRSTHSPVVAPVRLPIDAWSSGTRCVLLLSFSQVRRRHGTAGTNRLSQQMYGRVGMPAAMQREREEGEEQHTAVLVVWETLNFEGQFVNNQNSRFRRKKKKTFLLLFRMMRQIRFDYLFLSKCDWPNLDTRCCTQLSPLQERLVTANALAMLARAVLGLSIADVSVQLTCKRQLSTDPHQLGCHVDSDYGLTYLCHYSRAVEAGRSTR